MIHTVLYFLKTFGERFNAYYVKSSFFGSAPIQPLETFGKVNVTTLPIFYIICVTDIRSYFNLLCGLNLAYSFDFFFSSYYVIDKIVSHLTIVRARMNLGHRILADKLGPLLLPRSTTRYGWCVLLYPSIHCKGSSMGRVLY